MTAGRLSRYASSTSGELHPENLHATTAWTPKCSVGQKVAISRVVGNRAESWQSGDCVLEREADAQQR